jgi:hypothetical protein
MKKNEDEEETPKPKPGLIDCTSEAEGLTMDLNDPAGIFTILGNAHERALLKKKTLPAKK